MKKQLPSHSPTFKRIGALRFVLPMVLFGFIAAPAHHAFAQCETPGNAESEFSDLGDDIVDELNDFITQEENFITELVTHRAKYEMINRLWEFDTNIRTGLTNWWNNDLLPSMKKQTEQLSSDQVDQSKALGAMNDAQNSNDAMGEIHQQQALAQRRYQPNERSCVLDSLATATSGGGGAAGGHGSGINQAAAMSRALTAGAARDDEKRRSNAKGSPSEKGKSAEQQWIWKQFHDKFCDPANGDQGCTASGDAEMAGMHANLPQLLWGEKQTIDMGNVKNQQIVEAAERYYINPFSPDPVPSQAVKSSQGEEMLLDRHSNSARVNSIYNVIAQMVNERVGGSGVNTQEIQKKADMPVETDSMNASYRELMIAMSVTRIHDPDYLVEMVNYPEQVVREQGSINAIKMQQMNDIYHRQEELLFMEAAVYANTLDGDKPDASEASTPVR